MLLSSSNLHLEKISGLSKNVLYVHFSKGGSNLQNLKFAGCGKNWKNPKTYVLNTIIG